LDPPHIKEAGNDRLSEEEARMSGIEKLADMFTKLRWQPPDEKTTYPPVRFLNTTLDPAVCVLDEGLMDQMDTIHSQGPLKKKMKSEREIGDMTLSAIAKAMREEDGVPIKFHQWHKSQYPDSFIGYDFVSWLVREFRDMSTRAQATEFGNKLQEQGLFEHCRGKHSFLDGYVIGLFVQNSGFDVPFFGQALLLPLDWRIFGAFYPEVLVPTATLHKTESQNFWWS
jgi:hypothetical protein